jgi:glycosyltransferase involved in cell wall biosynthesis
MTQKIAVLHDGFIPVYRAPFFRRLNERGRFQYVVVHGKAPSGTGQRAYSGPVDFPNVWVKNREVALLKRTIIYQHVLLSLLRSRIDAVVIGHEIRFLSNLVLLAAFRMLGKPVIWWGHGFDKEYVDRRPFAGLTARTKAWLANLADGYIVYTEGGAARLRQAGIPRRKIQVVRNTLDIQQEQELAKRDWTDLPALRAETGLRPDSKVLLYLGRLYKEKRVGELITLVEAIRRESLCKDPVEALIVGDGPEMASLKEAAAGIPEVHFAGEVYDAEIVARYMRIAAALVIPGKVGLAVNHAFAHGLPVITRDHSFHAPEVEYISPGDNGLIVPGDFSRFVRETAEFLDSGERQQKMRSAALRAAETLTLDNMVESFDAAVGRALLKESEVPGEQIATRSDRTGSKALP